MCGGCSYNSHLSPRGLVPAFTLKHTSPSLWLLLSIQDACYTENLILYYWQMTKNVIEIEQVKKSRVSKMQSGTDEDRIISPHFLHYVTLHTQKKFFLNCQGSKLLSPLMLTVNCVSFLLDNRLQSFATRLLSNPCFKLLQSWWSSGMDLGLQFMPVQWDSNEGLNHPVINVHFGLLNKEQHLFWGIVMLGDKATDLCFLSKSSHVLLFWRSLLLWWEFVC